MANRDEWWAWICQSKASLVQNPQVVRAVARLEPRARGVTSRGPEVPEVTGALSLDGWILEVFARYVAEYHPGSWAESTEDERLDRVCDFFRFVGRALGMGSDAPSLLRFERYLYERDRDALATLGTSAAQGEKP